MNKALFKQVLVTVLLFNFICGKQENDSIPDLNLPNFDVREKFRDCFNEGTSENYQDLGCYSNWPIQFTTLVTDKICILKKGSKRLLSSMNINSCMKLEGVVRDCRQLKDYYNSTQITFNVVDETITFFNKNGAQYLDEKPYKLLQESDEQPAYFPTCEAYNSSIGNITVSGEYQKLNENIPEDYKRIKKLIYEEGPILAYLESKI
jgi:hypothetical protein